LDWTTRDKGSFDDQFAHNITEGASLRKNTKERPQKEHRIDCRASDSDHAFFSKRISEAAAGL